MAGKTRNFANGQSSDHSAELQLEVSNTTVVSDVLAWCFKERENTLFTEM